MSWVLSLRAASYDHTRDEAASHEPAIKSARFLSLQIPSARQAGQLKSRVKRIKALARKALGSSYDASQFPGG